MSEAKAWCEGVTVFGANVVCAAADAALASGAGAAWCTTGVAPGALASLSAFCASPLPLAFCPGCGDVDVSDVSLGTARSQTGLR